MESRCIGHTDGARRVPNRWVKADLLSSDRFNSASFEGQSVFVRLLLVADDHGRYDGRVAAILSACDPLQTFARKCERMNGGGTLKWFEGVLAELESVDLARFWVGKKGVFLLIPRFYERPRSKSKFEDPPEEITTEQGCTHLLADAHKCVLSTSTVHVHGTRHTSTVHDHEPNPVARGARAAAAPAKTAAVWEAYQQAHIERYGQRPTRNARVNGQISRFLALVPAEEAPEIAAFYVRHNKAFYVGKSHPVGLLVTDAEALRTQWLNGRANTETEARQIDRRAATGGVFQKLIEEVDRAGQ